VGERTDDAGLLDAPTARRDFGITLECGIIRNQSQRDAQSGEEVVAMKPSGSVVATSGSLISAALSFLPLSCCVFPAVFSFLGATGVAFAMELMPYRPYFIALNLVFLGAGFYFAYRPQVCAPGTACAAPRRRRLQRVSLWAIAGLTLALIAFPYVIAYLPV
jgi:mercuric ion transport protein